jgi:hypothetical protein
MNMVGYLQCVANMGILDVVQILEYVDIRWDVESLLISCHSMWYMKSPPNA